MWLLKTTYWSLNKRLGSPREKTRSEMDAGWET